MLGLWKSKKRKAAEEKNDLKAIVTEDLLGASEWKESKLGYLTGLSSIGRVGGNFVAGVSQSMGRVGLLVKLMTTSKELPSLPEISEAEYDGEARFREAMVLHGVSDGGVKAAVGNTRRSFYLYGSILAISILYLAFSVVTKESLPLTVLGLHLTPIMVFSALSFRSAYYNWMFRRRSLDSIKLFVLSRQYLPK